jgi:hypothetical protein
MIWYDETVNVKGTPENVTVSLIGHFDDMSRRQSLIEILVLIKFDEGLEKSIIVYSHDPTMLKAEDPSAEDILHRYQAKINKIRSTLVNIDYDTLFKK